MKWPSLSLGLPVKPLVSSRIVEHLYLPGMDHTGEARGLPGLSMCPRATQGYERTVKISRKRENVGMRDRAMDE